MSVFEVFEKRPRKAWIYWSIALFLVALTIWSARDLSFHGLADKGSDIAYGVLHGLFHPKMDLLTDLSSEGVPYLIFQTIAIAILGTFLGGVLAIPFAFLASENVVGKTVSRITRAFILMIRTIPSLIWALIWIRVTGPGPFCGVVTQMICSIGMISKMYITAIEDLDVRILESLDACGCNTFEKIKCGILPQLYANFISTIIYRFDINMKDASVLGTVGAGGIGAPLIQCIRSRRWTMVGAYLLGLIVIVLLIEFISTRIRRHLAAGE
ncbi:MAG: phosphonate ABC transporter, permease protein PhnE [Erysipelotrichaceae bacterium]|jgi:phosphonate transport system permease protein|nr:phosphonate ABC transporter, permease protein PhnE [Erysipelotrichaceae bacterium]